MRPKRSNVGPREAQGDSGLPGFFPMGYAHVEALGDEGPIRGEENVMANKVLISDLQVTMQLGNNGITLQVKDGNDRHRGYLKISKAYIEWYSGKAQSPSFRKHLDKFVEEAEAAE